MASALGSRGVAAASLERARMLLLAAAAVSFALSVSLWFLGHELQGIFVGLWVPSILSLGSIVLPSGEPVSSVALFIIGAFVCLLVAAAVALLSWGAILDGRYERERQGADLDAREPTDAKSAAATFDATPLPHTR